MKILAVQDMSWQRKGPWQQHHLMEKLSLRGHEIRVIVFEHLWRWEKGPFFAKGERREHFNRIYEGAEVTYIRPSFVRLPLLDYFSYLLTSRTAIKKEIDAFNPDVIIGFSSVFSSYWGVRYARTSAIPFVNYWYDIIHVLNVPKPFGPLALVIEKHTIKGSTRIVTINAALTEYLITIGAPKSKIDTLPSGVDLKRFDPSTIDRKTVRERYGFADSDLVLFFMGWIYPFSGLQEVANDVAKLTDRNSSLKLLIVGRGPGLAPLKEFVKQRNAEDRIIFTGYRPYAEIPELIAAADICILPAYDTEEMRHIVPIKIYEFLAMGKPVISTRLHGVLREFGTGNGVTYADSPETVVAQTTALDNFVRTRESQRALNFIKAYDWERITSDFEALLASIAQEKRRKYPGMPYFSWFFGVLSALSIIRLRS
jgi:glycosyltransferase involved in cell wall biosynthesis